MFFLKPKHTWVFTTAFDSPRCNRKLHKFTQHNSEVFVSAVDAS